MSAKNKPTITKIKINFTMAKKVFSILCIPGPPISIFISPCYLKNRRLHGMVGFLHGWKGLLLRLREMKVVQPFFRRALCMAEFR